MLGTRRSNVAVMNFRRSLFSAPSMSFAHSAALKYIKAYNAMKGKTVCDE
jgi:hypothetical protein